MADILQMALNIYYNIIYYNGVGWYACKYMYINTFWDINSRNKMANKKNGHTKQL